MADETKQPDDATPKATWLPGGEPPVPTEAPVAPHSDKPRGERQDGAGKAPPRPERNDTTPAGATADKRSGPRQGGGPSDDPFAAHRGEPARPVAGAARGAGSGAPGEEPNPDSKSGGDRSSDDASD